MMHDMIQALLGGCAVHDRSDRRRLRLTGEDRLRFLNGQTTCAVGDLAPGQGTYGFLTTIKGRVEAELVVLAADDALWLDLPPGSTEPVRERLEKYVIVDRVVFDAPERRIWTLLGPRCFEVAASLAGRDVSELPAAAWSHAVIKLAGVPVRVVREPADSAASAGTSGLSLWLERENEDALRSALLAAGAVWAAAEAVERLRVESGRPLYGVDFGDDTFPQETGLEGAVSYSKGCYLGQEVVARIHYRGGVQRHMRRLALDFDPAAAHGAVLEKDGKEVGTITSAALGLRSDRPLALAVVHQRAEVGDVLDVRRADSRIGGAEVLAAEEKRTG